MHTVKNGTPKSLREAIANGRTHYLHLVANRPDLDSYAEVPSLEEVIERHVQDFYNHKLAVLMLSDLMAKESDTAKKLHQMAKE